MFVCTMAETNNFFDCVRERKRQTDSDRQTGKERTMCFVMVLYSCGSRVWRRHYLILSSACQLLLWGRLISHACLALCYPWVCVCVCLASQWMQQSITDMVGGLCLFSVSSLILWAWSFTPACISFESRDVLQGHYIRYSVIINIRVLIRTFIFHPNG